MDEEKSRELARGIVAEALGLDIGSVSLQSGVESFEYWTSIKHIQIIHTVESTMRRSLTVEETLSITTVAGIADLLCRA